MDASVKRTLTWDSAKTGSWWVSAEVEGFPTTVPGQGTSAGLDEPSGSVAGGALADASAVTEVPKSLVGAATEEEVCSPTSLADLARVYAHFGIAEQMVLLESPSEEELAALAPVRRDPSPATVRETRARRKLRERGKAPAIPRGLETIIIDTPEVEVEGQALSPGVEPLAASPLRSASTTSGAKRRPAKRKAPLPSTALDEATAAPQRKKSQVVRPSRSPLPMRVGEASTAEVASSQRPQEVLPTSETEALFVRLHDSRGKVFIFIF